MKTLVIAEKPSVAQDIAKALGSAVGVGGAFQKHDDYFENEGYVITSAVGHLLEIQAPEEFEVKRGKWSFAHLPVLPTHFDLKPIAKTQSRLTAVAKLVRRKDVGALINACDAGREGELIFRLIEQYTKSKHPVQRLWLQSMTPAAIREGFQKLKTDQQMHPLADAARCRSEADWLVGINGTRAMTAFNSRDGGFFLTTVGRVQTPTLAIVVEREEQIRRFISRPYWEVVATFDIKNTGIYAGHWFDPQWKKTEDIHYKADRLWNRAQAEAIAESVANQVALVREESKPVSQSCPLLFDLTSLQREANARFGFSAKMTLQLAQSLYEKHKALTYPRTDSRALPEDYVEVAQQTLQALSASQNGLSPHAQKALDKKYVRPFKRVFDNSKVSDHFAIIPTAQVPTNLSSLSEPEYKLYDMVVRRFIAIFYPPAQYEVTTRISQVGPYSFKTEGKVLVDSGWLAVYDKTVAMPEEDNTPRLPPLPAQASVTVREADIKDRHTRPPARYTEATLLGAMEGAGKLVEDDDIREAMKDKGLGTPATRASIMEGLLTEKYLLREGKELIPTAKAFQLITLLRGLDVQELYQPALTGQWENQLSQMEKGQLSRAQFMQAIMAMTQAMVDKAKRFDRDTVPGDYATLQALCPQCGGVIKENYRRYGCTGLDGSSEGCGFSFGKTPAGRVFELAEVEQLLRDKIVGPLEGFRSKAGWPFTAQMQLVQDDTGEGKKGKGHYKLEFLFDKSGTEVSAADGQTSEGSQAVPDFSGVLSLGPCPRCKANVYPHGTSYVCAQAVPTALQTEPTCTFKTSQVILQQAITPEQVSKLLSTGKTDLLEQFVSSRTKRPFKAFLVWDDKANKVGFMFQKKR
jgi:DNA topoisomerase-3